MPTYRVKLSDGSTEEITAKNMDEAKVQQAARNAELANPTPRNTDLEPSFLQEVGAIAGGLPQNAMTGLGEGASAFNRSIAQGLDFMTSPLQALDNATGDRLPTFEGGFNELPGSQGGFMAEGTPRDMVRGYYGAAPAALGNVPVAGRNVATPAGAAFDLLGLGAASPGRSVAPLAFPPAGASMAPPPSAGPVAALPTTTATPNAGKLSAVDQLVNEGSESVNRAGFALDPYTGQAGADAGARASMKQGVPNDLVSMVQAASKSTKQKMLQMLEKVEQGREFRRDKSFNRPADVIGDSLLSRLKIVRDANRSAANQLDPIAESLKGQPVSLRDAMVQFGKQLDKLGVSPVDDAGEITADFLGSDVEGLAGPTRAIEKMLKRMLSSGGQPDAYDAHRLKRYIDEVVSYGKNAEGLSGNVERIMKELRFNINSSLGEAFPEYAKANKQYSETIQALDGLQDVAGKKLDMTGGYADKALGQKMRDLTGNRQSRIPLTYAIDDIDDLARKYSSGEGVDAGRLIGEAPDLTDDIRTMSEFANELESRFGAAGGTSFLGQQTIAADRAAETIAEAITSKPTVTGMLSSGGKALYEKTRGINEENALKAIRKLLEQ